MLNQGRETGVNVEAVKTERSTGQPLGTGSSGVGNSIDEWGESAQICRFRSKTHVRIRGVFSLLDMFLSNFL